MFGIRNRYMAENDGGGAGDAGAAGGADKPTDKPEDKPADKGADEKPAEKPGKTGTDGSDLAALKKQLAEAVAKNAAADESKTEAEKLREQLAAVADDLASTKAGALAHARTATMEALGVLTEYRDFAPADADPRTSEGRAALEKWASERPAMLSKRTQAGPRVDVESTTIFGEKGKGNIFTSPKSFMANAKKLGLN